MTEQCPKGQEYPIWDLFWLGGCIPGYTKIPSIPPMWVAKCVCNAAGGTDGTVTDGTVTEVVTKDIMLMRGPAGKDTNFKVAVRGFTPMIKVSLQTADPSTLSTFLKEILGMKPYVFQTVQVDANGIAELEGDISSLIDPEKETQVIEVRVCRFDSSADCTPNLKIRYTRTTGLVEEFTSIFGEAWKAVTSWLFFVIVVIAIILIVKYAAPFARKPEAPRKPTGLGLGRTGAP